jgi:hypothetical protein
LAGSHESRRELAATAAAQLSDAGDSYKLAEFLRTNLDADENTLRVLAPTLPERCTFVERSRAASDLPTVFLRAV